ncbi:MAG: DMP19 family protein [Acidobacteria bacterium]|nr:DMP19 family protein [Acidobacteriota bacterium]MBK9529445.1 DMP19 family protein [Acidobacteriota bacterium]MBP7476594.1 DMP19 family protein [Pyrinomonadaceae bacterium]MBP9110640.1 DMP19 family protein [Pyrinomonadaceae bacterium]
MDKPNIDELLASTDVNGSIIELDNYVCELCEWGESLDKLSVPQKAFYYNQELEREINNGGFEQYFSNSSGSYAHETVESLNAIGASRTAAILYDANEQFPGGLVPKSTEKREELMLDLWPDGNSLWEELETRFFAYEDNLNALHLAFVKANRESF